MMHRHDLYWLTYRKYYISWFPTTSWYRVYVCYFNTIVTQAKHLISLNDPLVQDALDFLTACERTSWQYRHSYQYYWWSLSTPDALSSRIFQWTAARCARWTAPMWSQRSLWTQASLRWHTRPDWSSTCCSRSSAAPSGRNFLWFYLHFVSSLNWKIIPNPKII